MSSKLVDELRKKFGSARDVLKALSMDEALLKSETESPPMKPTKFANFALQMTAAAVRPLLAKDAKIDLMPVFVGVTAKTFNAKTVGLALDAALKGKIAKDAEPNMGHVASMLDHIEHMTKPEVMDETLPPEQQGAMEAAARGEGKMEIPPPPPGKDAPPPEFKDFLKSKNMSEDDINAACDMLFKKAGAATDESPEDKAKREEDEKKKAEDAKKALDAAAETARAEEQKKAEDAMKGMVTKDEMNSAITAAVQASKAADAAKAKAIADVKSVVGDLAMSFDSAEAVYRHVAKLKGVAGADTLPASALPTIISLLPKVGARPAQEATTIALDAASADSFSKMFPGSEKIGVGTL